MTSVFQRRTPPRVLFLLGFLALLMLPMRGMAGLSECGSLLSVRSRQAALLQSPEKGGEAEPESPHEQIYKIINFLILAGVLGYLLRKPLGDFFRQRAQTITESLQQGRRALAAAEERLSAIEAKLANLDAEIQAFKDAAGREMEADLQRLRQAAGEESERTLSFARLQIDAATRAAALELRRYTAREAVGLAEAIIRQRLDDPGRRRLVGRFVEGLKN